MTRASRFKEKDIKAMVAEYKTGSTIRDLAVAWDCSTPTVIRLLHEGGLKKLRTKGRREKHDYSKPTTRTKHDIKYQRALKAAEKERRAKAKARAAAKKAEAPKPSKKAPGKSVKTDKKVVKPKTSQKKSKAKSRSKKTAKKATKKAA